MFISTVRLKLLILNFKVNKKANFWRQQNETMCQSSALVVALTKENHFLKIEAENIVYYKDLKM